jgi:hypothetical protein
MAEPIKNDADLKAAMEALMVDDIVELLNHPAFVVVQYQTAVPQEATVWGPYTAYAAALADRERRHALTSRWAPDVVATYGEPVTVVMPLWAADEED